MKKNIESIKFTRDVNLLRIWVESTIIIVALISFKYQFIVYKDGFNCLKIKIYKIDAETAPYLMPD